MSKSPIPTDTAGLIQHLLEVVRDQRTTLLVDRLCDLRDEMLSVIDQLAELDFDAFEFLAGFDDDDDAGDHGCAAVH
jgi:hypothetical protein